MVVLVLWSTKYLTPSRVYRISQPSGRGSSFCKLEGEVGSQGGRSRHEAVWTAVYLIRPTDRHTQAGEVSGAVPRTYP